MIPYLLSDIAYCTPCLMRFITITDKDVRDEGFKQLKRYLSTNTEFTSLDMMKLWKGLFYCKYTCLEALDYIYTSQMIKDTPN